jgi:hypothetical protein
MIVPNHTTEDEGKSDHAVVRFLLRIAVSSNHAYGPNLYSALATAVLFLHALFIVWVIFGAVLTRSRPILRWLHIVSLIWGILTELMPWPCL